jgi:hypothetical protein
MELRASERFIRSTNSLKHSLSTTENEFPLKIELTLVNNKIMIIEIIYAKFKISTFLGTAISGEIRF